MTETTYLCECGKVASKETYPQCPQCASSKTTLPPIGPCAECGREIEYGESYTVLHGRQKRHASCTEDKHWLEGADYAEERI